MPLSLLKRLNPFRKMSRNKSSIYEYLTSSLFFLSEKDAFRHVDAVVGCLIMGAPGSGKSSGSGKTLRDSYLGCDWMGYYGYGFLVLTAKVTETQNWLHSVQKAGREDDLIIVNEQNHWRCNLIAYLLDKGESVEQVVKRIIKAVKSSSGSLNQSSGGAAEYFDKAFEQLLINSITLLQAAKEDVTFANIYLLVRNTPIDDKKISFIKSFKSLEDAKNAPLEIMAQINFFDSCAIIAKEQVGKLDDVISSYEVEEALTFFFTDYASMPANQRQAVYATLTANIDPLARGIYNKLFSDNTNFTPEESRNGKIIILDIPVNKYDYVGKFVQNLFKNIWLSDLMKEPPTEQTRICCLWMDEYQNFIEESDMIAFSQSREYFIAPVILTQNLPALYARTNDRQSLAKGISGSLVNKIFHANNDVDTNLWAADLIGQEWRENYSYSVGNSSKDQDFLNDMIFQSTDSNISANISSIRAYKIEPNRFNILARGGYDYDLKVEAIFTSTRKFKVNGKDYLLIQFTQEH